MECVNLCHPKAVPGRNRTGNLSILITSICLSVCLYVGLHVGLYVHLSVSMFVFLSFYYVYICMYALLFCVFWCLLCDCFLYCCINQMLLIFQVFAYDSDAPAEPIRVDFLHHKFNGYWNFPETRDIKKADAKYVLMEPERPSKCTNNSYRFAEDEK